MEIIWTLFLVKEIVCSAMFQQILTETCSLTLSLLILHIAGDKICHYFTDHLHSRRLSFLTWPWRSSTEEHDTSQIHTWHNITAVGNFTKTKQNTGPGWKHTMTDWKTLPCHKTTCWRCKRDLQKFAEYVMPKTSKQRKVNQ